MVHSDEFSYSKMSTSDISNPIVVIPGPNRKVFVHQLALPILRLLENSRADWEQNLKVGGPKIGKVWRGVCRVLGPNFFKWKYSILCYISNDAKVSKQLNKNKLAWFWIYWYIRFQNYKLIWSKDWIDRTFKFHFYWKFGFEVHVDQISFLRVFILDRSARTRNLVI